LDAAALAQDRETLGLVLETFVFQEIRRQASWLEEPVSLFHFRDKEDAEVDIVLERGGRQVAGIEVKAGATVKPHDFRGLRKLQEAAGKRFACGAVLYDGETTAGFGEGLYAVPMRALWE
jgi:predicted AAA+ superfamily ATPase